MAGGYGCGEVVDKQFDGYFACGVCKGQIYRFIKHGGQRCGMIVYRKLDRHFVVVYGGDSL